MKYWHEATDEELKALVEKGTTIKQVNEQYIQPDWCDYPGALDGMMGCWSLTDVLGLRHSISHEFCKTCPCYKNEIQKTPQQ